MNEGRKFLKFSLDEEVNHEPSDQEKHLPQPPLVKAAQYDEIIKLPMDFDSFEKKDLTTVIRNRKSSRVYTKENVTLNELSYLLWATQGIRAIRGKSYATLRTVPSGGARHAFETYLAVNFVEGLKPGKYHYLPMEHSLEYIGAFDEKDDIGTSLVGQLWAAKASVVFYWSFVCYRAEWRYGAGAYRPIMADVGHVGENLYLACSMLDLGTCGIAAFDSDTCNNMFKLDGEEEFVIYTQPVGTISLENQKEEDDFYAFVKEQGL